MGLYRVFEQGGGELTKTLPNKWECGQKMHSISLGKLVINRECDPTQKLSIQHLIWPFRMEVWSTRSQVDTTAISTQSKQD